MSKAEKTAFVAHWESCTAPEESDQAYHAGEHLWKVACAWQRERDAQICDKRAGVLRSLAKMKGVTWHQEAIELEACAAEIREQSAP